MNRTVVATGVDFCSGASVALVDGYTDDAAATPLRFACEARFAGAIAAALAVPDGDAPLCVVESWQIVWIGE